MSEKPIKKKKRYGACAVPSELIWLSTAQNRKLLQMDEYTTNHK